MLNRPLFILLFIHSFSGISAQSFQHSPVNITLVPGISTIGPDPGNHYSSITLNLLAGYQRGSYWFEVSGLSSTVIEQSNGIQISGLANTTGIDFYQGLSQKEIHVAEEEGFTPFLKGIQVAGMINYV